MKFRNTALASAIGIGTFAAARAFRERRRIDFLGRTVLITGGSRGLGLVLARMFADEGARLALLARDPAELLLATQELSDRGAEVIAIQCDVRDQQQVQAAVAQVIQQYGRIDVLVNNAGVIQVGPIDHIDLKDFDDALGVHVWGPLYMTQAVAPYMRQLGSGRIVNIASIGGRVAVPHLVPYSTSKFALVGLSDGLRAELFKDNILVSTVCPGLMRTGSHFNALFKGQHAAEFTWFSLGDAMPFSSVSAETAAHEIIETCRYGEPHLTISVQARTLAAFNALFPNLTGWSMTLVNQFLPKSTGAQGDEVRSGWESQSALAPSVLTQLADDAAIENNEL